MKNKIHLWSCKSIL